MRLKFQKIKREITVTERQTDRQTENMQSL